MVELLSMHIILLARDAEKFTQQMADFQELTQVFTEQGDSVVRGIKLPSQVSQCHWKTYCHMARPENREKGIISLESTYFGRVNSKHPIDM